MEIIPTKIDGVKVIRPKVFEDSRGYFMETYQNEFFKNELGFVSIQDNESKSKYSTLRGLHYQLPPYTQAKLVRVIKGTVLDVVVDIRTDSPTFGEYQTIELSAEDKLMFYIPRGLAHGFIVLSEEAIFQYKVDNQYSPRYETGISYEDTKLNINWKMPRTQINVSAKDALLEFFICKQFFTTKEYLQNPTL